ncbi:hypothetical protein [Streptomyces cinerochromogenes]|uniref:hypothetical protein n=1 Tax=Streptomyces cinerochromogenes TaxID=66422 RepID=UPI0016707669|nr:hypothetical protein [Streptomyces cinerochromogenes]GGS75789.1 hypothetical protein GCM10010206_42870 [Streptomyces cinerochromogenes]
MLRILDARTGEPVPAAPARRGLTRIEAHASGLDPTGLRVLLTADLLVRALELGGTPVWTILNAPRDQPELRTAATRLAVRPFEDDRDLASGLGEAQVLHVAQRGAEGLLGEGPVVSVAPAEWVAGRGRGEADDRGAGGETVETLGAGAGAGAGAGVAPDRTDGPAPPSTLPPLLSDPSVLRLALLTVPRSEPARLDPAVLDAAARSLARWRRAVAGWARRPSRPVPAEVRDRLRAAWEDDLDLPAVLGVLRDVESAPGIPDGARFETYAYADRLLALDLARDLGGPA